MKAKLILNNKEYEVEINEEQIKEIKKPKYKRWRAEEGEEYYFLSDLGEILSANDCRDKSDNFLYNTDNYFKTVEEAEFRICKLLAIQEYEDFLGNDLVTDEDWKNPNILKYKAYFDFDPLRGLGIRTSADCLMKYQGAIYSKSKEKIEKFIKEFGEDNFKKYILEVKE